MSQDFTLYLDLTVEENIDFMAGLRCIPHDLLRKEKDRLLHFARMAPFRHRKAGALSGGMKKKLALCCALIHRPKLLLLDEPTTAVDPVSRGELWRILYEFILQGISVVIATPYMDEAERCHRVALLQEGQIIACDAPKNLKSRITTTVCSFACGEANRARRILRQDLGIEAQVYGGNLRVFLDDAPGQTVAISERLAAQGLETQDFLQSPPNMDDVYLFLLPKADGLVPPRPEIPAAHHASSGTSNIAVQVENISKHYGTFRAVDEVSFEVNKGTVFGLLGANGAGKTTLIKMLCGLVEPTEGTGAVAGFNVATHRKQAKSSIGYMSQLFSLYPDLTVAQNLDFYASIYGLRSRAKKAKIDWTIGLAGLRGKEKYLARELPTGWKQKLALGAAIMHQPEVLFLDEPTSGVDPVARTAFWDIIYELSENGVTTIVTTHFMDEAERCNLLGLISAGRLIGMAAPEQLKADLPAQCYEVRTPSLLGGFHALQSLDVVHQVALYGDCVHVLTRERANDNPLTSAELGRAGVEVDSVVRIRPTLEDVFVHLITADQAEVSA